MKKDISKRITSINNYQIQVIWVYQFVYLLMDQMGMGVAAAISALVVLLHFTANIFLASKKFDIKIILKSPSTYAIIVAVSYLYFDLEMPGFVENT